ncbi:MAG: universal stress protein [Chloroflexia bacterium]|nr:universal stress protein [Chloroflexia bacterium]
MTMFNRILAPLDGSARAETALGWITILPARHVRLLQVCPGEDTRRAEAEEYLTAIAARVQAVATEVEIRVVHDEPAEGIVAAAADADLVVMCTQGAGDGGRLLYGSVADRVARHAPVPTLLVRGGRDPIAATPVRRIVVPLDGSPAAERALPMAAKLATILAGQLHFITVDDADGVDQPRSSTTDKGATAAHAYLEQMAGDTTADAVAPSTEVRSGEAGNELLTAVGPGDLLVITTHGRGAARRWQIGRVAEKLLRHAAAPIVLIRADSP